MTSPKKDDCVIVLITKDNTDRLKTTLAQYGKYPYDVVVIDDSTDGWTKRFVESGRRHIAEYHGRKEQANILRLLGESNLSSLILPLGMEGHTLGYCRNYAVLYSVLAGYRYALMIDDDIVIRNPSVVDTTFRLLQKYEVVGATTLGMPDDSILGHISLANSTPQYDYITGQYSGLSLDAVKYPFPNVYNEDLIMYALQGSGRDFARYGEIEHIHGDYLRDLKARLLYQEWGEILLWGFADAVEKGELEVLRTPHHWNSIVRGRVREVTDLRKSTMRRAPAIYSRVFKILQEYHRELKPQDLASFSNRYFATIPRWRSTLTKARQIASKRRK